MCCYGKTSKIKTGNGIDFYEPNSSNILLSFLVLDESDKAVKIRAIWNYLGNTPTKTTFTASDYKPSRKVLEFIANTESPIPYVYDDADKSNPPKDYCKVKGDIKGNLTIGIGKIILNPYNKRSDGKTNLEYWCAKSPLSNDEMWDIFESEDVEDHLDRLKSKFETTAVKYTQCQWDALLSVIYNRGSFGNGDGYWNDNMVKGKVEIPEDNVDIENAFISAFNWNNAKAKGWFKGLMCRRIAESQMFINCTYTKLTASQCDTECEQNDQCNN